MKAALADLEFAQQLSKQGLLGQTTTCCATGTRSRDTHWSLEYPVMSRAYDDTDPADLRRHVGRLVLD
jgi:hypothetical protein